MENVVFDSDGRALCGDAAKEFSEVQKHIDALLKVFPYLIIGGARETDSNGLTFLGTDKAVKKSDAFAMHMVSLTNILAAIIRESDCDKESLMQVLSEALEMTE